MKQYIAFDLWIQLVLIPLCFLLAVTGYDLFTAYYIVGGWQMLSVAIHLCLRNHYLPIKARRYYSITAISLLLVGLILLSYPTPLVVFYGYFMLIISPLLALWYVYICREEKKLLEHKEFVHLK